MQKNASMPSVLHPGAPRSECEQPRRLQGGGGRGRRGGGGGDQTSPPPSTCCRLLRFPPHPSVSDSLARTSERDRAPSSEIFSPPGSEFAATSSRQNSFHVHAGASCLHARLHAGCQRVTAGKRQKVKQTGFEVAPLSLPPSSIHHSRSTKGSGNLAVRGRVESGSGRRRWQFTFIFASQGGEERRIKGSHNRSSGGV